jgi:hypothetical protein
MKKLLYFLFILPSLSCAAIKVSVPQTTTFNSTVTINNGGLVVGGGASVISSTQPAGLSIQVNSGTPATFYTSTAAVALWETASFDHGPDFCFGLATNTYYAGSATSTLRNLAWFDGTVSSGPTNGCGWLWRVPDSISTTVSPIVQDFTDWLGAADTSQRAYVMAAGALATSSERPAAYTLSTAITVGGDASGAQYDSETAADTTLSSWNGNLTAGQWYVIYVGRGGNVSDTSSIASWCCKFTIKWARSGTQ